MYNIYRKALPLLILLLSLGWLNDMHAQATLTVNMSQTAACNYNGTATTTVSGGTSPYTYVYYHNNTTTTVNSANATHTLTGLPGGFVNVQVTDANNRNGWGWTQVTPPFQIQNTTTMDTCSNNTGSASLVISGGQSPYTYLWSTGATTANATGLAAGQYDVTVTDANGCVYAASLADSSGIFVWPYAPFNLSFTTQPSSCNDGQATVTVGTGGVAPYTYYWSTTPVQTTPTAINLAPGSYRVKVTDSNGCEKERWVFVPQGAAPYNVAVTKTDENCGSGNGSISLTPSGGQSPYTYLWSTGATTASITGLSRGWYSVTVTDGNGCPVIKSTTIRDLSPVTLSISTNQASCAMTNGTATVTASNGVAPYTYSWSNNQTTQTATGLAPGHYWVTVTDANGCTARKWATVSEDKSCYVTISGRAYRDLNGNCTQDGNDIGMSTVFMQLSNGDWTTTDHNGDYDFVVPPGTYTVTQSLQNHPYYTVKCPGAGSLSVTATTQGNAYGGNDFANEPNTVANDLRVSISADLARPGRNHRIFIRYFNDGTTTQNATVSLVHDALNTYLSSTPSAANYTLSTRTATWNLGPLSPGASGRIVVYTWLDSVAVVGSYLQHTATILPNTNDSTPANNVASPQYLVRASYDPNDKQVSANHGNDKVQPQITVCGDTMMMYMVRFQNTGNDTAFDVVIRDTISSDHHWLQMQPGAASHPYTLNAKGNGVLEFDFSNIMLPDSNMDEPNSHGFVSFYLPIKGGLAPASQVSNNAAIYFDFNAPVITNNALTDVCPLNVENPIADRSLLEVFPNPSTGNGTLRYSLEQPEVVSFRVMDMMGKTLLTRDMGRQGTGTYTEVLDASQWPAGIYLIEWLHGEEKEVKKWNLLR